MSLALYKGYTDGDKAALKELKAYMEGKVKKVVPLSDAIAAVEPTCETPRYLLGI